MLKKLLINMDMDDVLCDLLTSWIIFLNLRHSTNVSPSEVIDWDIAKFFPTLSKEQVFAPIINDKFWQLVHPAENAAEVIITLLKRGHEIKIITNTDYRNVKPKMELLFKCFPMIKWKDVIITSEKQNVKCDVLVDDKPDNLIGGNFHRILMDKPHNKDFDEAENGMVRVRNLVEACAEILKLENK